MRAEEGIAERKCGSVLGLLQGGKSASEIRLLKTEIGGTETHLNLSQKVISLFKMHKESFCHFLKEGTKPLLHVCLKGRPWAVGCSKVLQAASVAAS